MDRKRVYNEIESFLGQVPTFLQAVPDASLALEWQILKTTQFEDGPIPPRYRALIGVAVAAALKCQYTCFFHTESAKLNGATRAEIQAAIQCAQAGVAWSTWLAGMQFDLEQFKKETLQICDHIRTLLPVG